MDRTKNLFPGIATLCALLLLAGCKEEKAAPPNAGPPEVPVALPLEQETQDWDEYTGRVEAIQQVAVRSRVSGYINEIAFTEGAVVQEGELLFIIDPRQYQAEVTRAEAELERAKTQAELSRVEFSRAETLRNQKVISAEQYDQRQANATLASSAVRSAESALATAQLNLDYCYIKAPITGQAGLAKVTPGNLVQPGGEILTTLVSQDPMYVYVDVDENALLRYNQIRADSEAQGGDRRIPILLELANETGYPHEGYIDFLDNRVDPSTGTIRMRGVFENSSGYLTPGLFARVRVPGSLKYTGLLVPDKVVATDQNQRYVLVVNAEDKVEYRKVEPGPLNQGMRVIKSGIGLQDRVVISGMHLARPGAQVVPQLEALTMPEPPRELNGGNAPPVEQPATPAAAEQSAAEQAPTKEAAQP